MSENTKQLHWSQRVALVRHNLHAASRSCNFHFFKTLQANGFVEGTNHVAALSEGLGDESDIVLAALENLNAGLAYSHQDAFQNVYDNLRNSLRDGEDKEGEASKLYVDITMQKNMADMAIDKMASSALALIQLQPTAVQDAAASVWITGVCVVADTVEVTLQELHAIETKRNDFIRLEDSWNTVKASAVCAVTVLKGIYRLMDPSTPQDQQKPHQRSSSIVSASGLVLRRLSNAFVGGGSGGAGGTTGSNSSRSSSVTSASILPQQGTHARRSSLSSPADPIYRTASSVRNSVSNGCPTSLPSTGDFFAHKLSTIPPTPGSGSLLDEAPDPFDTSVPLPEIPSLPAMPPLSLQQKMFSQAAF